MAKRIITTAIGNHYIVFGDRRCKYELLESVDIHKPGKHNFELRVKNRPDDTYAVFSVIDMTENTPIREVFKAGLKQAKAIMDARTREFKEEHVTWQPSEITATITELQHLLDCIIKVSEDF